MPNDFRQVAERTRAVAESVLRAHGDSLPPNHHQCPWAWNEVWIRPKRVLRISNTSYTGLATEALLAPYIPRVVGHPAVIAAGKTKGRCWILQQRVPGKPLGALWDRLPAKEAHRALRDLFSRLDALHEVRASASIKKREPTCYLIEPGRVGAVITQLQECGAMSDDLAASLRCVYHKFWKAIEGQPFGVIHGDLHLYNAMYDPSKKMVSGIIDFEDCGYGPLEMDAYMLAKSVLAAGQPRAVSWLKAILAEELSLPGARERWTGYAVARLLGATTWDPDMNPDGSGDVVLLAELCDNLDDVVVRGYHAGATLLK